MVSLDWLRLVGSSAYLQDVIGWLSELTEDAGEEWAGCWRYRERRRFPGGAFVAFSEGVEHFAVEVPGGFLRSVDRGKLIEVVLRMWNLGFVGRRVDFALDCFGDDPEYGPEGEVVRGGSQVGLIAAMSDAVDRGELCRARRVQRVVSFDGPDLVEHQIRIGKRGGKLGSGRFVRVYDKGLETGQREAGEWERFEVEFSADCAEQAFDGWARSVQSVGGPVGFMRASILGAIEFRESGKGSACTRKLAGWWRELIGACGTCRLVARRSLDKVKDFRAHVRRAVAPKIAAIAQVLCVTPVQLFASMVEGVGPSVNAMRSMAVMQARTYAGQAGGAEFSP